MADRFHKVLVRWLMLPCVAAGRLGHMDTAASASANSLRSPGHDSTVARRIVALDVLRGVALLGIILVNVQPVTHFHYEIEQVPTSFSDATGWLQLFVQQRFFPIFSLLFGMGFSLFFASAERRGERPRVRLARRLLVLLPLGALHQLIHPGEALFFYAVVGLVVLLPSTWLPRWAVSAGAGILILASLLLAGGGLTLIPGAFLLGSALVRHGVVARMESSTRVPLLLFAVFAVASVAAAMWQLRDLGNSGFTVASAVAGALMAGAYVTGVLVLLRTPARRILNAVFAPLGKMALTNYVTATLLMLLGGALLDLPHSDSWGAALGLAVGIIVVQAIWSTLWLSRYTQGPLEWLWRWATWGRKPDFRLDPARR